MTAGFLNLLARMADRVTARWVAYLQVATSFSAAEMPFSEKT